MQLPSHIQQGQEREYIEEGLKGKLRTYLEKSSLDLEEEKELEMTWRGALSSVVVTIYYSGDHIKKTEKDRTCSTYGEEKRCIHGLGG